jgi:hypothetical protein
MIKAEAKTISAAVRVRQRGLTWYAVAVVATGRVVHVGRSLSQAAAALVPGTCHAQGPSKRIARFRAAAAATHLRQLAERSGSIGDDEPDVTETFWETEGNEENEGERVRRNQTGRAVR